MSAEIIDLFPTPTGQRLPWESRERTASRLGEHLAAHSSLEEVLAVARLVNLNKARPDLFLAISGMLEEWDR